MLRFQRSLGLAFAVGVIAAAAIAVQSQARQGEWRYFGGDKAFTRYSPLDQINRDNVKNLQIVWRRPAVDDRLTRAFPDVRVSAYLRSTPIMIDGMLFTQDAHGFIGAFDPGSGVTIWQQEPFARTAASITGAAAPATTTSASWPCAANTFTRSMRRPASRIRISGTKDA